MCRCCCFEVVFSSKPTHNSSSFCGIVRQLVSVLSLKSKPRGTVVQGCQISTPTLTPTMIHSSQVLHRGNSLIIFPIASSTHLLKLGGRCRSQRPPPAIAVEVTTMTKLMTIIIPAAAAVGMTEVTLQRGWSDRPWQRQRRWRQ
jgi:hypothetical protein